MKTKIFKKILIVIVLLLLFVSLPVFPFTDQITSERILNENKHFIEFINITITNFGDKKVNDFQKIYNLHFNAEVSFLQADYKRTYKRVYSSQHEMVKLYMEILKNYYLEDSKNILDKMAPGIIRSKNAKAKHYLTLGYRDRTVGWTHYLIGDATNPKQYSKKLYSFEKAIKMTRRAKRYGFLALFESQKPEAKVDIYNHLLKQEKKKMNLFFNRFLDLKEEDYIKETGKTFKEHEKDKKSQRKKDDTKSAESDTYENLIKRRVRFKNEKRLAESLLNQEFAKAELVMRKYVTDYNFKLLLSTFEVLANKKTRDGSAGEDVDYGRFKIHLMDNYSRLSKESVVNNLLKNVKVEDDISQTKKEDIISEKKNKTKISDEKNKNSAKKVIDKKETK